MAWADMFMSYMHCFVVRNIPLHIDYWWQDLSLLRLSGKLRGRRKRFFGIQNSRMSERRRYCHFDGVLLWFHWMMSLDNPQCVRWRESRRDDDIFVSVNNHWVIFLWNRIYTLSSTPFYERTAIKLYSLTLCVLYPKHYSYQHPSYLGVLDMCLILSLYLHVLSLYVGFRSHYLWYCLYVYLLIICMYYFICGFYVSLSFGIVYMYIYLCIYLLKVGD